MSTIIVTGGAGYIGSHTIIELLADTSVEVISLDNFSNSSASAYERVRKITGRDFRTFDVDLCDQSGLNQVLAECGRIDAIIHFAAYKSVPESMEHPLKYYNNNLQSLNNILAATATFSIPKLVFSSSCSVYGNADQLPVTEDTPVKKAESAYGHTKQVGEDIIRFYCHANPQLKAVLLRYFNPVGAHISGQNGEVPLHKPNNLVPVITQTASGKNSLTVFGNDYDTRDGSCIRDYIHVSDIATAHVNAISFLDNSKDGNVSVFNLGSGEGVSVLEAIGSFEKVSGVKLKYQIGGRRPGDVIAVYSDNSRARKALGWEPRFGLDDMMLSAWKWQQHLDREQES